MDNASTRTPKEDTQIAVMANDISYIKTGVKELNEKVDHNYVTKEEFKPIKQLVYGMVGLILTAFMLGVLSLVVLRK